MIDRRSILFATVGVATVGLSGAAGIHAEHYEPELNDDGLYKEPFFVQSFLDLEEDLVTAHEQGKRFAVMWELKGCPYCKETHLVNFADHEIREFVSNNFDILQLNIAGARQVTDFDGEVLSEKKLAHKWGVRYTPTTNFFPEAPGDVAGRPGHKAEVVRMPGYFKPPHFLAMYRYVAEKAYEEKGFQAYLEQRQS